MRLALPLILSALTLGGCTNPVVLGSDYSHVYPDGAIRIRCGAVDCEPGKVCCSQECGVCAAFGACPPPSPACGDAATPCGPDAVSLTGSGSCTWFVWNGVTCVEQNGCSCTGSCALPQPTYIACMELHTACWSRVCSTAARCPLGYFCERTTCEPAANGACRAVPSDCSSAAHAAVCGCDQIAYTSSCEAARAAQSTISGAQGCGVCNPPSIVLTTGAGCPTLGWAWDGRACVEQTGCGCTGDCTSLEPTEASCIARYQSACAPMFPCGSRSCQRAHEVCNTTAMGWFCEAPNVPACASPTCACLVAEGFTTAANCTDDGDGRVVVVTP